MNLKGKGLFIIFVLFILAGCQKDIKSPLQVNYHGLKPDHTFIVKQPLADDKSIIPLETERWNFQSIIGWATEEDLLFSECNSGKTVIYQYNIFNGEKTEKFVLSNPLISASISPDKEYLLIHSAPYTFEAAIQVLSLDEFNIVYETVIQSSELTYEWNSNDERKLFVSAFFEDWTYESYIINIEEQSKELIAMPQPFAEWIGKNELLYLNWEMEHPTLEANLASTVNGETINVISDLQQSYYINSWKDLLLTISMNNENEDEAVMVFHNGQWQEQYSFIVPHLANYSGWQTPFYDFVQSNQEFYIIEPKESGIADYISPEFQLVKRNIKTGENELIFDTVENSPLMCSPNGESCLFGYEYENIIITDEKEILPFLQFKKTGS